MSNTAIISFKIAPDHYAVLKAMATSQQKSLSEFVRETIEHALDLDQQARLLASFFAGAAQDPELVEQM